MISKLYPIVFVLAALSIGLLSCKSEGTQSDAKKSVSKEAKPVVDNDNVTADMVGKENEKVQKNGKGKGGPTGKMPVRTYRIIDNSINGVKIGMKIVDLKHVLVRGRIELGGRKTIVQRIKDDKGGPMGYILPKTGHADFVGKIVLTSKKVLTSDGIRVGDTFAKLKKQVPDLKLRGDGEGDEIYAIVGSLEYKLDKGQSPPNDETKITEIVIADK